VHNVRQTEGRHIAGSAQWRISKPFLVMPVQRSKAGEGLQDSINTPCLPGWQAWVKIKYYVHSPPFGVHHLSTICPHMTRSPRPSAIVVAYCKQSKTVGDEGMAANKSQHKPLPTHLQFSNYLVLFLNVTVTTLNDDVTPTLATVYRLKLAINSCSLSNHLSLTLFLN